jgi:hypothetical protein
MPPVMRTPSVGEREEKRKRKNELMRLNAVHLVSPLVNAKTTLLGRRPKRGGGALSSRGSQRRGCEKVAKKKRLFLDMVSCVLSAQYSYRSMTIGETKQLRLILA